MNLPRTPNNIAVSPAEAAAQLGVHSATFYRHIYPHVRSGAIQSLKIGRCRRILMQSLLAWVERQSKEN